MFAQTQTKLDRRKKNDKKKEEKTKTSTLQLHHIPLNSGAAQSHVFAECFLQTTTKANVRNERSASLVSPQLKIVC